MILSIRNTELQPLQIYAPAKRKTCRTRRTRGLHLIASAEVITKTHIKLFRYNILRTYHKVINKDAACLNFFTGRKIIVRCPSCQVNHSKRNTYRRMAK